jgi:uncharacterized protein (UPF0261 family)
MIDKEGGVFYDAEADRLLFDALRATLDPTVEVIALDTDINDPAFAIAMAEKLDQLYQSWSQHNQEVKHETSRGAQATQSANR